MNTTLKGLILLTCAAASAVAARAYQADCSTVGTQLFVSAGNAAPTGSVLWLVADTALNGVPTNPAPGSILGPDDVLIQQDIVDGALGGAQPGQYQRFSITVDDALSNANIIVYLWNVVTNTPVGEAGQTFGILNLGVVPPPGFGNAEWTIASPVLANQFSVMGGGGPPPGPAERLDELQADLADVNECLANISLLLLDGDRVAAAAGIAECIESARQLLAKTQSPDTVNALGQKGAAGLEKKVLALIKKLLKSESTLIDLTKDDTQALKAMIKASRAGAKSARLFLKFTDVSPFLVLEEVKSKGGYHAAGEIVFFHITVFDGDGATNCSPVTVAVTNLPGSDGLDVVVDPGDLTDQLDFSLTMGADVGAAGVTATGCAGKSSRVILINLGPAP